MNRKISAAFTKTCQSAGTVKQSWKKVNHRKKLDIFKIVAAQRNHRHPTRQTFDSQGNFQILPCLIIFPMLTV